MCVCEWGVEVEQEVVTEEDVEGRRRWGGERERDVEKSEDGGVLISCLGVGGRRCVCVCVCVCLGGGGGEVSVPGQVL